MTVDVTATKDQIGLLGKKIAANYLIIEGYKLVELNVSNEAGEIDIVSRKPDGLICFIQTATLVLPAETTPDHPKTFPQEKIQSLHHTISSYLEEKEITEPWQLAAILIYFDSEVAQAKCRHVEYVSLSE